MRLRAGHYQHSRLLRARRWPPARCRRGIVAVLSSRSSSFFHGGLCTWTAGIFIRYRDGLPRRDGCHEWQMMAASLIMTLINASPSSSFLRTDKCIHFRRRSTRTQEKTNLRRTGFGCSPPHHPEGQADLPVTSRGERQIDLRGDHTGSVVTSCGSAQARVARQADWRKAAPCCSRDILPGLSMVCAADSAVAGSSALPGSPIACTRTPPSAPKSKSPSNVSASTATQPRTRGSSSRHSSHAGAVTSTCSRRGRGRADSSLRVPSAGQLGKVDRSGQSGSVGGAPHARD